MSGKADRMARVARIRSLQKRQALALEAQALRDLDQLRHMANRIESLRNVYAPAAAEADSFALKSMVHQYERLGNALVSTRDREARAGAALDKARTRTLEAHRQKRAADELAARAEAAEAREAERKQDRNAVARRSGR